ncbi:MAG: hotdog fold thioesterase [Bacteroidetes bacterium]|jgi:1,4-dihydroxy-2-naphthoyl-CoA hydrolase|nr:hotdog fold thioesterase [Bacteroidota bacterium]
MNIDELNKHSTKSLIGNIGIKFTGFENKTITATMPVDERTIQPFGYLHGGAMLALIETLGSAGSVVLLNDPEMAVFGASVSANHLRSMRQGTVTGIATPTHLGRSTHTWEVKLYDEEKNVISTGLVMNIIKPIEKN